MGSYIEVLQDEQVCVHIQAQHLSRTHIINAIRMPLDTNFRHAEKKQLPYQSLVNEILAKEMNKVTPCPHADPMT